MNDAKALAPSREIREKGSGCLIPPRVGITAFWTAQVMDRNGKLVRRSTRVRGELKPGSDPKLVDSWTNITAAKAFLKKLVSDTDAGTIAVGSDPAQIRYGKLRQLYMNDYREQQHKSLRVNSETEDEYVDSLKHLDAFFGFDEAAPGKADEKGAKVATINGDRIRAFKAERQAAGAANGTINRSLSALVRMFNLAVEDEVLHYVPVIKRLPEPKQPRQGFLEHADYERLYAELGREVKNVATGRISRPSAYVQPMLQVGYWTGMRLGEIKNLRWSNIDLSTEFIRLYAGETKNDEARLVPMNDGLPEMFESLRRANPDAGPNDKVFTNKGEDIASFIKAWRNACVKAAIPTTINGQVVVSHFEERAGRSPKYHGFLFHDLRRTFATNSTAAGAGQLESMAIGGWKTPSVFKRYNIKQEAPLQNAAQKISEYLRGKSAPVKATRLAVVK